MQQASGKELAVFPGRAGKIGRGSPLKVLIIDDHPIVISGCRAMAEQRRDIEIIGALTADQGYQIFCEERPEIAVVDINLPGISGLELTRRLLVRAPAAKIIVFSMNDNPAFAARAIEAGARGFLTKNDDPAAFLAAIDEVASGGVYLTPAMAKSLAFKNHKGVELSGREIEILRLLRSGRSLAEIAGLINLSYKTVANNCSALKTKLGAKGLGDLVRIAIEQELV